MKKILIILSLILVTVKANAAFDNDPFDDLQYVENRIEKACKRSNNSLENVVLQGLEVEYCKKSQINGGVPGRMSTFWFTAIISGIGTYTLYGAGAGPVACGIIYVCTDGDREITKKAVFGCLTGAAVGGLVKWLSVQ